MYNMGIDSQYISPMLLPKIICVSVVVIMVGLYVWDAVRKHNGKGGIFGDGQKKSTKKKKTAKKSDDSEPVEIKGGRLLKDLLDLFIPLIVALIIFNFVIGLAVIQSPSMEPTLMVGNTVFVNRLCYKTGQEIERGDIVVFDSDEFGKVFGKRVIGLPGDHIEFKDGYVMINGQYCDESAYIGENIETNCSKSFDVPDNCYFLLGDNRENSNDSRFWKNPYIPKDKIMGRYMGQIDFSIQYDIIDPIVAFFKATEHHSEAGREMW